MTLTAHFGKACLHRDMDVAEEWSDEHLSRYTAIMTRHLTLTLAGTFIVAIVGEGHALAQKRDIAKKAVKRARRAIAIGPMVGGGLALGSEDGADGVISFGLGIFLFNDSVFDIGSIQNSVQDIVKQRVAERLAERGIRREDMNERELKQLEQDALSDLKQEMKRRLDAKPESVPRPRVTFGLEGAHLPGADAWQIRAGLGIGISKIYLGPTLNLHLGDANGFAFGLESGFHYLLGSGTRPLTLQLFARYDYFVNNRDALGHQGALGLRIMLDLL